MELDRVGGGMGRLELINKRLSDRRSDGEAHLQEGGNSSRVSIKAMMHLRAKTLKANKRYKRGTTGIPRTYHLSVKIKDSRNEEKRGGNCRVLIMDLGGKEGGERGLF